MSYWHVLTCNDMCWHVLTCTDVYWRVLTCTDMCWHVLTWPDMTWHVLTWADMCWHQMKYAGLNWHMLTCADNFWHVLTLAKYAWITLSWINESCIEIHHHHFIITTILWPKHRSLFTSPTPTTKPQNLMKHIAGAFNICPWRPSKSSLRKGCKWGIWHRERRSLVLLWVSGL